MIDFETPESIQQQVQMLRYVAENMIRPISREFDEKEHEKPTELFNFMWETLKQQNLASYERQRKRAAEAAESGDKPRRASNASMATIHTIETMAWGDVGIYLSVPNSGLGGAAVEAAGTPAQKERFLKRFSEGEPKWGAMAITEAGAGSDTAAIKTRAVHDPATNEWVLNGEKIFCTSGWMAGEKSKGFVVIWATIDPSAGRAGIKSFIVDAGTPGMKIVKLEKKLGIRASDTATILLQDCRIPYDNMLGTAEVGQKQTTEGYKGVLMTFDATRPAVAASAIGVARAALEMWREELEKVGVQIRYDKPKHLLTAMERDYLECEAQLQEAWLLTKRAAWMSDNRVSNSAEASMCKVKGGMAGVYISAKAVEWLGPLGFSKKLLIEKFFRDSKIGELYEGTRQINLLIIARRILGFSSSQLR
ncbi:MAG: acyl-CoA dehydrogenase family protein [Chloroflexi bacterium]|nr:acyl-CoA dehydrogenase family protein [Chloroflexota bacterium]